MSSEVVSAVNNQTRASADSVAGTHLLSRRLKIEASGDFWKGAIKPKIRLMGRWLEQAGFKPGSHVQVSCSAFGVIQLQSSDALSRSEPKLAPQQADLAF